MMILRRFLLQAFLSRYGACHIALDGYEAVDAFEADAKAGSPFDLICMDIMMPLMDGKEAALRVRKIEEELEKDLKRRDLGGPMRADFA